MKEKNVQLFGGCIAGICQTIIGHPFDTVKVLIQNNIKWNNLSIKEYFRGWTYPLMSGIGYNILIFPIYHNVNQKTESPFFAGGFAGIIASPLTYTFDVGKILQQTNKPINNINQFIKTKGIYSTIARESLATSIYFGSYKSFRNYELSPFISGGLAGLSSWTFTYPIDVIRSRQISQDISFMKAYHQKHLWKGFEICALRAILVNACVFHSFEACTSFLRDNYQG